MPLHKAANSVWDHQCVLPGSSADRRHERVGALPCGTSLGLEHAPGRLTHQHREAARSQYEEAQR
jgi:hypothetical protein